MALLAAEQFLAVVAPEEERDAVQVGAERVRVAGGVIAAWQNRPHDGLRDPLHPGRAFTPNEKYAAMAEAAGYVPVALTADDHGATVAYYALRTYVVSRRAAKPPDKAG